MRRKEEYSRKKSTTRHVIFDGKDLVKGYVIIKKGKGHVSLRSLGGLSKRKSQWKSKSSNSSLFIFIL